MNKSIVVNQMALPCSVLDHICSFNFYNEDYVISRNKENFKKVLHEICSIDRICYTDYFYMNHIYYVVQFINLNNPKINIRLKICIECGKFIQQCSFSKCSCNCHCLPYFTLFLSSFIILLHVIFFKYY